MSTESASLQEVPRWKIHRRLYDWVIGWSESPYGLWALFVIAFVESSFFPIPPDVLLVALVLGNVKGWYRAALVCMIGSVLGGALGYMIGQFFMEAVGVKILEMYHAQSYFEEVTRWYEEYDYWIVFAAAFSPIPYKVFTIASGAFGMNLFGFLAVSAVGRGGRFFLVAGLLRWFGPALRDKIERYFDLLTVLLLAAVALGFAVITLFD